MRSQVFIAILVMAVVTYLIRVLPLVLLRKPITNPLFKSFLYYVPYVTLAVMTFPAILTATANIWSALVGFIVALILGYMQKSLITVSMCSCISVFLIELLTGI